MYDLAIVGGGTAGASAATFAGRAGLQTVVIDADKGMTRRAMLNNHLGFPEGVTGPDLVDRGQQQAERAGATWVKTDVTGLERREDSFALSTGDGQTVEAREVLLALGANLDLARAAGLDTRRLIRDVRRKPSLLSTAFGPPSPHTAVDREAGWSPTEVPRQAVASRDDHTEEARKPASMAADRYLAENSPALTPATKAVHSSAVNRRTGLLASLESRSRTSSPDMATSTQALLPQKLLLRQSVR